jgi:hypothetical protein
VKNEEEWTLSSCNHFSIKSFRFCWRTGRANSTDSCLLSLPRSRSKRKYCMM